MSPASNVVAMIAVPTVVDHLLAAHGSVRDPVSKALIEAALVREGKILALSVPIESFDMAVQNDR